MELLFSSVVRTQQPTPVGALRERGEMGKSPSLVTLAVAPVAQL